MIKLQAREIIRTAKRLNMTLSPGSIGSAPGELGCALAVVRTAVAPELSMYNSSLAKKIGKNPIDLEALEFGFEDDGSFSGTGGTHKSILEKNRYFKVGQRVRKLAGIK